MTTKQNCQRFDKCPHCGSHCGLELTKTVRYTELFNFFGECMSVDGDSLRENKFMTCFECKKKVISVEDFKTLHDME